MQHTRITVLERQVVKALRTVVQFIISETAVTVRQNQLSVSTTTVSIWNVYKRTGIDTVRTKSSPNTKGTDKYNKAAIK